jgi:histidinol-phosphatase (PHP family)
MVAAAKSRDVNRLSITEHISQFQFIRDAVQFSSTHETGRMFTSFDEYLAEFAKVDGDPKIQVRKGLEVDYIEEFSQEIREHVTKEDWDFLLLSVHELSGGIDVERTGLPQDKESSWKRWKEYFETQKRALQSDIVPFSVLTHPVRLAVSTPVTPDDLDSMLDDLAAVAVEKSKALELNGKDMESYPQLVNKIARACAVKGCKVSYGSDSHHAEEVSRKYELAAKLAKEFSLEII